MDGGIATVWAAAIGLVTGGGSALLSGILAYKAGRRQIRDQGLSAHRQWLCQQRQEAYVAFLECCDAFVDALDACVLALGTAEATHDLSLYEDAIECVDVEVYLTAQKREGDMDHQLGRILMLSPAEVSDQASTVRASIVAARRDLGHLTDSLIPNGPLLPELEPLDDGWSKVERSRDEVVASRSAFVAIAHATLTESQALGWS
ncbi:hypothetical protein [Streptomyces hainanensis]|uniref:Uncharacterized protein n=1 Tax=Streptomyces hainanensis TaxID=402648 RepID=A0A4R4TBZ4_9ACTN|nr:hypothetical protein [Streptomyces hainanensis]TDC74790.1 hypothetical protein E1283_14465 [Streptomyces hainanensis]